MKCMPEKKIKYIHLKTLYPIETIDYMQDHTVRVFKKKRVPGVGI